MKYFSEIEKGSSPRTKNEIPHNAWSGLASYIITLIDNGYFAEHFPEQCPEGQGCYGTNEKLLSQGVLAEIPELSWPLVTEKKSQSFGAPNEPFVENYLTILDFVQFCYEHISKPEKGIYHSYYQHHHLINFDKHIAQAEFIEKVNRIFSRNGLAYELKQDGSISRILTQPLANAVSGVMQKTADLPLNQILESAASRISNPNIKIRYDALKDLWDAWERIKTLKEPSQSKKQSIESLLQSASTNDEFRKQLETEAKELTTIGNSFFIRHSEVSQIKIEESDHIDYLFHRLASMLCLLSARLG